MLVLHWVLLALLGITSSTTYGHGNEVDIMKSKIPRIATSKKQLPMEQGMKVVPQGSQFLEEHIKHPMLLNGKKLNVLKWHTPRRLTVFADVTFGTEKAFMKCYSKLSHFDREMTAFDIIRDSITKSNYPLYNAKRWVAKRLGSFRKDGYPCIIITYGGDMNMSQYANTLSPQERSSKMFKLFYQIIHGPRVTIIDFDYSVKLEFIGREIKFGYAPGGTFGYYAPEFFREVDYDMRKSDGWSVAITMYNFYTGQLLYGMTETETDIYRKQSMSSYAAQLKKLYAKYKDDKTPLQLDAGVMQKLASINHDFTKLLIANPEHRPTPEDFVKQWGYLKGRL
ncbi:kinase-like domain-containing protein [Syncephalis plumigaleata]|nr:kinase-like domain-containing protein [Syncephalis plumigaleata]